MRRIILLAVMFVAALSPLVAAPAPPALADSAEPFHDSGCETDEDIVGNVYEVCFEDRGVEQRLVLPSGGGKRTLNVTTSWTLTVNGVLAGAGENKVHEVSIYKANEVWHVNKQRASGFYSFPDMSTDGLGTCTYMYNFIYSDGELRHYTDSFECTT